MENRFYMECPSFDAALAPVPGQEIVLNASGDGPARDYSHPIDGKIVKTLDNPLVNNVFKTFVDTMVDAQYGQTLASAIPVTARTFPELNAIVDHCARTLHIRRPYVVVSESFKFNACTMGSDESPFIILGSMLTAAYTTEQMQFVIGHECGHIAMGHVIYHTATSMASSLASMLPVIGPAIYNMAAFALNAWSRRSEITADRAGMLCCGRLEVAQKALMQLEMGLMKDGNMDAHAYIEASHRYRKGGILRNVGEYMHSHPILPKRMEALELFQSSALYYDVTGLPAPAGVISQDELNRKVEAIIRVL